MDASPPLAGLVFDGSRDAAAAHHPDLDYQRERGVLAAHWEPFSDPHSAVVGYAWRAGLCPGCGDVVPDQQLGLVYGESLGTSGPKFPGAAERPLHTRCVLTTKTIVI